MLMLKKDLHELDFEYIPLTVYLISKILNRSVLTGGPVKNPACCSSGGFVGKK